MVRPLVLGLALISSFVLIHPAAYAAECEQAAPVVVQAENLSAVCSAPASSEAVGSELAALVGLETVLIETSTAQCLASCDCCTTALDCPKLDGFRAVCDTELECHAEPAYGQCLYC